jgi:hypothetical protein
MTAEGLGSGTIDKAFLAAYLLAGSSETAENAVLDGIAALDFSGMTERVLVAETVKAAIRRRIQVPCPSDRVSSCPPELKRLALLAPVSRDCFVLGVLCRMTPGLCSAILNLTAQAFGDALCAAYQQLPFIEADATVPPHRFQGVNI